MKKNKKNKNDGSDIMKNKEDEEYISLKKIKKKKGEDNLENTEDIDKTIKYKKIIRLLSIIIVILVIIIIILLFSRIPQNKEEVLEMPKLKSIEEPNITQNNETNLNDNETKIDNSENNNKVNETITEQNNTEIMPKRKIYVKYIDFWPAFKLERFDVHRILLEKYEVIQSDNPDYVIFGEFGGENYGIENRYNCVKLFLTIENRGPDFSNTDYAIGIHYIENGDRYFRKPTETHQLSAIHSVYNVTRVKSIDIKTKKFCAWVVSNGSGDVRNLFFDKLSQYKKVDSGGGFRNNIGRRVDDKLKFLADYKFSICFENSKTEGYISEKLSDAFEAGTIPIYYGDDTVQELLNNKSYIHVKDESDFDEKIELIKKIDQNDTLYLEMIKQNIVIDDSRYPRELQKYKDWIYHIFEQDKEKAKRFKRKNESEIQ